MSSETDLTKYEIYCNMMDNIKNSTDTLFSCKLYKDMSPIYYPSLTILTKQPNANRDIFIAYSIIDDKCHDVVEWCRDRKIDHQNMTEEEFTIMVMEMKL